MLDKVESIYIEDKLTGVYNDDKITSVYIEDKITNLKTKYRMECVCYYIIQREPCLTTSSLIQSIFLAGNQLYEL